MVATNDDVENLVYGMKLSSVVPAAVTEGDIVKELTCMDLVMKLHYLRGVYFFTNTAVQGLKIGDFKEHMFHWLELYYVTAGRIRRSETGRPFIKCNDSGVRIMEARSDKSLDEWLEMKDSLQNRLVSNEVLGPELAYSPLVLIQFTWFKCGGLSVGINWSHVLGDAFSASKFMNAWSQLMSGKLSTKSLQLPKSQTLTMKDDQIKPSSTAEKEPRSVRRVEPVGDHWVAANTCKMETYSFLITASQLHHLQLEISRRSDQAEKIPTFEALSAVIWQCIAKTREGQEPRLVTICRNDSHKRYDEMLNNNQILSVVEADFSVIEAEVSELASLIIKKSEEEKALIEETVEKDQGLSDFQVYGANLTFVDLEELGMYGLELKGHKPVFANYTIHGVSNEGVVLVLPGPEDVKEAGGRGRTVTVILQENQVKQLREELKKEWCIV